MGQYYFPVLLSANSNQIVAWFDPHSYSQGAKLIEHSYFGTSLMNAVEAYLHAHTNLKLVWAGDYSRKQYSTDFPDLDDKRNNLYHLAHETQEKHVYDVDEPKKQLRWIVNHTKKLYIDKLSYGNRDIHPLPLLTQETDETASGDYRGVGEDLLGTWAHDVISVESTQPSEEYIAYLPRF